MSLDQFRQTATVNCPHGLHARPAKLLVETAMGFSCDIQIRKGDQVIDAKSVLQVLTLGATFGTELEVESTGEGAKEATLAVVSVIEESMVETTGSE